MLGAYSSWTPLRRCLRSPLWKACRARYKFPCLQRRGPGQHASCLAGDLFPRQPVLGDHGGVNVRCGILVGLITGTHESSYLSFLLADCDTCVLLPTFGCAPCQSLPCSRLSRLAFCLHSCAKTRTTGQSVHQISMMWPEDVVLLYLPASPSNNQLQT